MTFLILEKAYQIVQSITIITFYIAYIKTFQIVYSKRYSQNLEINTRICNLMYFFKEKISFHPFIKGLGLKTWGAEMQSPLFSER